MNETIESQIFEHQIIPVVTLRQESDAVPLVEALVAGGLPIAEIALRTEGALDGIRAASRQTKALIGAGSVMNVRQCHAALEAGASFIVSPGLDDGVVEYCLQAGVACFPGISTATELQRAFNLGLRIVKFFPAEACGGLKILSAIAAPFPQMRFVPTGGITPENLVEYLHFGATFAVGGSWMVRPDLCRDGKFDGVSNATAVAKRLIPRRKSP